jgi:hypothetical protein
MKEYKPLAGRKLRCETEDEKVQEILEQFNQQFKGKFAPDELEKEFSCKDVFAASYIAYHLTEEDCHKSEFNNELICCLNKYFNKYRKEMCGDV